MSTTQNARSAGVDHPTVFRLESLTDAIIDGINKCYMTYSCSSVDVSRIKASFEAYPLVLTVMKNEIIGFAYCFRFAPDIAELANIFVKHGYRDQAYGARMLDIIKNSLPSGTNAILAVNSSLHATREFKRSPDNFYIESGFKIIARSASSVIYMWKSDLGGMP